MSPLPIPGRRVTSEELADLGAKIHERRLANLYVLVGGRNVVGPKMLAYLKIHPEPAEGLNQQLPAEISLEMDKVFLVLWDRKLIEPQIPITKEAQQELDALRSRVAPAQAVEFAPTSTAIAVEVEPTEEELDNALINRFLKNYDSEFRKQYREDEQFRARFDRLQESGAL